MRSWREGGRPFSAGRAELRGTVPVMPAGAGPVVRCFKTRKALAEALAERVAAALRAGLAERGVASLAVSGGSTPKLFFAALSACDLDWANVMVTLVDERWVGPH